MLNLSSSGCDPTLTSSAALQEPIVSVQKHDSIASTSELGAGERTQKFHTGRYATLEKAA